MTVIAAVDAKGFTKSDHRINYCDQLGLEINMQKSKILVFKKGGWLASDDKWFLGNDRGS